MHYEIVQSFDMRFAITLEVLPNLMAECCIW